MKLRDCSKILVFFKIGAFIIAFKRNINSRIYPTEKCREKDGVIRHIDALIRPTLSKRFAFALYQPWFHALVCGVLFISVLYIYIAHVHGSDSVVELDIGKVIIIDSDTVLKYAFGSGNLLLI